MDYRVDSLIGKDHVDDSLIGKELMVLIDKDYGVDSLIGKDFKIFEG